MTNRGAGLSAVGKEVMPKGALDPVKARSGARENIPRTVAEYAESYPPMTCIRLTIFGRLFLPLFLFRGKGD